MTRERRSVVVDCVTGSALHGDCDAVVLVDVIMDATAIVSAVAQGRATFVASSASAATALGRELQGPVLAADDSEAWRPGFVRKSPAALAACDDGRPLVVACGAGQVVGGHSTFRRGVYVTCFRNLTATVNHLQNHHSRVLVVDAPSDGEGRCEDQIAAARVAAGLIAAGFEPGGFGTRETVERWAAVDLSLAAWGRSAEELRRVGREGDLEFVLAHADDLDVVCSLVNGEAQALRAAPAALSVIA
jgi:phosphosulfolactate phosphohydrolase-like enzyme